MHCVVTGGAGFIGSNLVDALLARGDTVAVLDNLSTGKRHNLESALAAGARAARGRCHRRRRRRTIFAQRTPEVVFHLAAQIDVRVSVTRPERDATINVLGTIAVLEAARAASTRRVVNTSTGGGLYGDAALLPTPEDYVIAPLAPYGQSKYAAEGYCALYTRLHGLSTVSLRYGNVYGPRQDVHGEAGVVAIFCGHLLEGRAPTVFGDGRQTRDWVDVADVVAANLLAADHELDRSGEHRPRPGDDRARPHRGAQRRIRSRSHARPTVRARTPRRSAAQLPGRDPRPDRAGLGASLLSARGPAPDSRPRPLACGAR